MLIEKVPFSYAAVTYFNLFNKEEVMLQSNKIKRQPRKKSKHRLNNGTPEKFFLSSTFSSTLVNKSMPCLYHFPRRYAVLNSIFKL